MSPAGRQALLCGLREFDAVVKAAPVVPDENARTA